MASESSVLKSIEDRFLECSYCLEYFKDPKQLPCLHRFCGECLNCLIQTHRDKGTFPCPLCNETCIIPSGGVDAFKTDFLIKSLHQFIQLQRAADAEEVKECAGCCEERQVIGFCFKCTGFLCEACYNFHHTSRMVRDHLDKVLALKDATANNITLEKLASLREAPRCNEHPDKPSEICCATCGNVPVCILCGTLGKHKSHDLQDVSEMSTKERDRLDRSLRILETREVTLYQTQEDIERTQAKLKETIGTRKRQLESKYELEARKINDQLESNRAELERELAGVDCAEGQELANVEDMREIKIRRINQEMDKLIFEKRALHSQSRTQFRQKHDAKETELLKCKETLSKVLGELTLSVDTEGNRKIKTLAERLEQSRYTIARLENVKSTASHVLASHNGWTDIQCLPDITLASEAIVHNIEKPPFDILHPEAPFTQIPSFNAERVLLKHRQTIGIGRIHSRCTMNGMASLDHGNIVLSGYISAKYAQITTVDLSGRVLNQKLLERGDGFRFTPSRYCTALSESEVLSASPPNVFGIYDLRRSELTPKPWKRHASQWITCLASHQFNDRVFVGCNDRVIHSFDKDLDHPQTHVLPEVIEWPVDIAVNDNDLLFVCDQAGGAAYALLVGDAGIELLHEFVKPASELVPFSVCTDVNGFVYMLWGKREPRCVLAQYSGNGSDVLASREIDADSIALATVLTEEGEKLLVITERTRRLQIYDLVLHGD